jgi:hypothetical protein
MAPECQEKNAKGLTIAVVGMNKAAEEFVILDEAPRRIWPAADTTISGAGRSARPPRNPRREPLLDPAARATGTPAVQAGQGTVPARHPAPKTRPPRPRPRPTSMPARKPWSRRQEKLALLYNEQGLRPAEIADKLSVSSYLVTQIILAAKNRGKL